MPSTRQKQAEQVFERLADLHPCWACGERVQVWDTLMMSNFLHPTCYLLRDAMYMHKGLSIGGQRALKLIEAEYASK